MTGPPPGGGADRGPIETALRETRDGIALLVRLKPGASASRIEGLQVLDDGRVALQVRVTAVPEKGKANKALIALLAKAFKLPKSDIEITAGSNDRRKTLVFAGPPAAIKARILAALSACGPVTTKRFRTCTRTVP